MAKISIREASRQFQVARATLSSKIKDGSLSSEKDDTGRVLVDTSELARIYEPRNSQKEVQREPSVASPDPALEAAREKIHALELELERTRSAHAVAQALADERATHLADLRHRLPPPETGGTGGSGFLRSLQGLLKGQRKN